MKALKTKHVIDPVTHAKQMEAIRLYAEKGIDHAPRKLRFVTWTLKYNRCRWLEILALQQHYERAEFIASVSPEGTIEIEEPKNITEFAIDLPVTKARIGGQEIALPDDQAGALVFARRDGVWTCLGGRAGVALAGKRPGLQGPIDDAFTAPFLCVRGTGQPWNSAVGAWADASLRRFTCEWARYMRGDLPVKNDADVTEDDLHTKNLILFGDPGSNAWIRKALPQLPVAWSFAELQLSEEHCSAKDHAPVLICASPFPEARGHYLVLNSGHTFHEKEFAAFNYLLSPRLGDWAVMKVLPGAEPWQPSSTEFPEEVVRSGFFDEKWEHPHEVSP